MSILKELFIPFVIGGSVITTVKFMSTRLDIPALAAIFGGLPIGLVSIYFISSENSIGYAHNYFYVTLILSISIIFFYLLRIHTKMDKNFALSIALLTWATLVFGRYLLISQKKNNNNK